MLPDPLRGRAHTVFDSLLGVETIQKSVPCSPTSLFQRHSRSLLSGEALEEHLRVGVDAQVLNRLRVR